MGYIFYFMGKSSSGKDTLCKKIRESLPTLKNLVGYTTRQIRSNETNGKEYFFVDKEQLARMESENLVIEKREYHTMHGIWTYFTADDGQMSEEDGQYILIGTLESYVKVREYYGSDKVVPIYIEVEDGERLSRALERERQQTQPKYAELCRRFLADEQDFCEENLKAAGIRKHFVNSDLEKCFQEILQYVKVYCL